MNCRNGGQLVFRQNNSVRMRLRDGSDYNMLELYPPSSSKYCKIRMKQGNGNYLDMIAPLNNHFYFEYKGTTKCIIYDNGNVRAIQHLDAPSGNLTTEILMLGLGTRRHIELFILVLL